MYGAGSTLDYGGRGTAPAKRHDVAGARAGGEGVADDRTSIEGLLGIAIALHRQGRTAEAERAYGEVLAKAPASFDALYLSGLIAMQTGRFERGITLVEKALYVDPDAPGAHHALANAFLVLGRSEEALASYDRVIALEPDLAGAHYNRGNALQALRRPAEAVASYDRAIASDPRNAQAHNNRANALRDLGRLEDALASYGRAEAIKPGEATIPFNRGNLLQELGRVEAAVTAYDRAIALKPDFAEAHGNRGNALKSLKRFEEAVASYDRAIALKPGEAASHYNRGVTLARLKAEGEAVASYDRAIALKPDYADAHNDRGAALRALKREAEALASYDRAIALNSGFAEALYNRGNLLQDLLRPEAAIASYDEAVRLRPDYAEAWHNRANALNDLKRYEDAVASYDHALALKPDLAQAEGAWLLTKLHLCDWTNFATDCAHLLSGVRSGKMVSPPFSLLAIPASSEDQLRCARLFSAEKHAFTPGFREQAPQRHERIRLAYLSSDFRAHAVAFLAAELFERHDRARFETIGISHGIDDGSETRRRLATAFDAFHDVRGKSNAEIAQLLRALEIDIAIDLNGYTQGTRLDVLAERPAPIQVSYLGYPGTTGADFIDYLIADPIVIPPESRAFYSEKLVFMPHSYQVNDTKRTIGMTPTRRSESLPEEGFVFCCFNNNFKILPALYERWMRVLKQVDGSVLWLLGNHDTASANLRKEAEARGVSADRLVFAERLALPEHLARHRLADLFLDTLPYNAHTTASDALWAGLPLLTCRGETFAGRVAASLLQAIGLPELIAADLDEYERRAVALATDRAALAALKRKLAENRLTTALFDSERFTRSLEAAYQAMVERHAAGLSPDHISVPEG